MGTGCALPSFWLASLGDGDRALLADRLAGHSLQEVADRADLSLTVAFQRLRRLGEGLAAHAGIAVAREKRKQRGRAVAAHC
jgi:hypothetical protein